jgi:ketosteroid isomerase-like protein
MENKEPLKIDPENFSANLRTYLAFVKNVEGLSDDPEDYRDLIHPEAEFLELPNLLNKNGQVRGLEASLGGLKNAKMILEKQTYEIAGFVDDGERVVVEKVWTGKMSMDVANLKKGQELKAYICAVVEFKDGRIYRHRTYDCYEPFV